MDIIDIDLFDQNMSMACWTQMFMDITGID